MIFPQNIYDLFDKLLNFNDSIIHSYIGKHKNLRENAIQARNKLTTVKKPFQVSKTLFRRSGSKIRAYSSKYMTSPLKQTLKF